MTEDVRVSPPAASAATCPICGGERFSALTQMDFGNWDKQADADLTAWRVDIDIGVCDCCGHVMVTTSYDAALISRIYLETPQDDTYWGDGVSDPSQPYRDMADFCGVESFAALGGDVVDLGCGAGGLLRVLRDERGVPSERLLGVDFNRRVDESQRFVAADLDALDPDLLTAAGATSGVAVAFAAHVLEHLRDPRRFLRAVARLLRPEGLLYVEVPDADNNDPALVGPVNLVNQQHIHYFAPHRLVRMAESCGFTAVRTERRVTGSMPRLQCLLRRDGETAGTTGAAVAGHLALLRRRRAELADQALAALAAQGRAGLWGVGADCRRLMAEHPALRTALADGRLALFDYSLAGRRYGGALIAAPAEIGDFPGVVFLTPALGDVRGKMRRYAASAGFPPGRVVDPQG